jgi:hypothetical protein
MLRFTCCFLYAMESLLVLGKWGGDADITSPFFYPHRFFVVVISACRSFRPLLPYSSSHEVRFVSVPGCIRTPSPIPIRWRAGQRRGALASDVGSLGWLSCSEALLWKCWFGQRLVRCDVELRKMENTGW